MNPLFRLFRRRLAPLALVAALAGCGAAERTSADRFTATGPLIALSGGDAGAANACFTCHGLAGEGLGAANPPLGGQPAAYLAAQMDNWRLSTRRNDPGNVMLRISQRLTPREIASLSAYAAALPGDLPRQVSRGASPAARRDDSRNGASTPPPRGAEPGS